MQYLYNHWVAFMFSINKVKMWVCCRYLFSRLFVKKRVYSRWKCPPRLRFSSSNRWASRFIFHQRNLFWNQLYLLMSKSLYWKVEVCVSKTGSMHEKCYQMWTTIILRGIGILFMIKVNKIISFMMMYICHRLSGNLSLVTTLPPKGRELPESYSQELFLLLRRRAS